MSTLEEYEKRMKLAPLTTDEILSLVEDAEAFLQGAEVSKEPRAIDETPRVVVWLHDRLQAVYAALEKPKAPVENRCGWCWRAAGATEEAWHALPKMNLDNIQAHAAVCEHNPLVQRVRELMSLFETKRDEWHEHWKSLTAERDGLAAEVDRLGRDVKTACANHQEEQQAHARTSLALREAAAKLADLQGRKLGSADAWAEAASEATGMYDHMRKLHEAMKATIRSLLSTELPAGELRKAIEELVR